MCKSVISIFQSILSKYRTTLLIAVAVFGTLGYSYLTLRQIEPKTKDIGYSIYNDEELEFQLASAPVKSGTPILPPAPGPRKQFSDFFYVSASERTRFNEVIWFWMADTLRGPVWTNDTLHLHTGAVFYDSVWARQISDGSSATFYRGYFETDIRMRWSRYANEIRNQARSGNGTYLESNNNQFTWGMRINGHIAYLWRWETGLQSPFDIEPAQQTIQWDESPSAVFVDGDLWVQGDVSGKLAIGASGNIRLMDNLVYTEAMTWPYLVSEDSPNYLTVVSEAVTSGQPDVAPRGILIANTWANGRENGANQFAVGTNQHRRDIALHGAYIALNGSFTFEQQNDNGPYEPYVFQGTTHWDERGYIYLWGSIAFKQKDYVHRGNTATTGIRTGYLKSYRYDQRFRTNAPPFQPAISFR